MDALVLRDRDANLDGGLEQRHYVQQDANFNVTAPVETDGDVAERFVYDPYGVVTVLDADWTVRGHKGVAFHPDGRRAAKAAERSEWEVTPLCPSILTDSARQRRLRGQNRK